MSTVSREAKRTRRAAANNGNVASDGKSDVTLVVNAFRASAFSESEVNSKCMQVSNSTNASQPSAVMSTCAAIAFACRERSKLRRWSSTGLVSTSESPAAFARINRTLICPKSMAGESEVPFPPRLLAAAFASCKCSEAFCLKCALTSSTSLSTRPSRSEPRSHLAMQSMLPSCLHFDNSVRWRSRLVSKANVCCASFISAASPQPSAVQTCIAPFSAVSELAPIVLWSASRRSAVATSLRSAVAMDVATSLAAVSRAWCKSWCDFRRSSWCCSGVSSSLLSFSVRNFCACANSGLVCPWSRDCLMACVSERTCRW
mmetsp:Transcript_54668/g.158771  ORF Transcript_54668/g.158771 Transcript_54668/m.158771 type:complete len:316 (-) Transcript_54668:271-1218(-)